MLLDLAEVSSLDFTEDVVDVAVVSLGRPMAKDFNDVVGFSCLEVVEAALMQKE